jgi:hypothetical protein
VDVVSEPLTPQRILNCPMRENDAFAATVADYLVALLKTLWREEQGFSGKRPFGNSSWQWEVYESLGEAGLIEVTYDEWEEPKLADRPAVDKVIEEAIDFMGVLWR